MLKPYQDPYGYKKLLAYKKAEELQMACSHLTPLENIFIYIYYA